jgi:hypothetical protein
MKDAMMLYAGRVLMGYCTGVLSYVVGMFNLYSPDPAFLFLIFVVPFVL